MIRINIFILLFMFFSSVYANEEEYDRKEINEICIEVGTLGSLIMQSRQMGAKKSVVLTIIDSDTTERVQEILRDIINSAYSEPIYSPASFQRLIIKQFGLEVGRRCVRRFADSVDN